MVYCPLRSGIEIPAFPYSSVLLLKQRQYK